MRARILLVEDEPDTAKFVAQALSETHDVRRTSRATDALAQLAAHHVDLVLVDWGLSDDASEVLEWVQQARVPVVVVTGDVQVAGAMQAAGRAHLLKPFSLDALRQAISDELDREIVC